MTTKQPKSWRDHIKVHPAAELFPLMTPDALKALGEDIKTNGLRVPVTFFKEQKHSQPELLDGRNRLDAMEAVGLTVRVEVSADVTHAEVTEVRGDQGVDPYEYVLSANVHRRHLTTQQKLDLLDKVMKANPNISSRRVAKLVGASPTTATKRRHKLEAKGDVSTVDTSIDTKGRKQPTRKSPAKKRRDIDDYLAEKKVRTAATKDDDAPGLAPQRVDPDHLISHFSAQVRSSGLDIARQIEVAYRPRLIERLREVIDEIEIEAERWAKEARRPEEMPDIPACLKRT